MITIVLKNGFVSKYYGQIEISIIDPTLHIEAHSSYPPNIGDDELMTWSTDTYDWFYIEDIQLIKGQ